MSQSKRHRAESDSEGEPNDAGATNSTPQRKTIDEGVTSTQPLEPEESSRKVYSLVKEKMVIRRRKAEMYSLLYRLERADYDLDDFCSAISLLRAHKKANNIHLSEAYKMIREQFACRCPANASPPCCGKCRANCACWIMDERFEDCKECSKHVNDCNHYICNANYGDGK